MLIFFFLPCALQRASDQEFDETSTQFSRFSLSSERPDPQHRRQPRSHNNSVVDSPISRKSETQVSRAGSAAAVPDPILVPAQSFSAAPKLPAETASGPYEKLRELLYSPPCPLERILNRLRVSLVTERPTMSLAGFISQLQRLDPTLTKSQLRDLARAADVLGVGSVDLTELHRTLVAKFGRVQSSAQSTNVIERVRAKILQRAGHAGFNSLRR